MQSYESVLNPKKVIFLRRDGLLESGGDRPLRVCIVSPDFPKRIPGRDVVGGGVGAHTYNLAHGLAELGHEIVVLTKSRGPVEQYQDRSICVHAVASAAPRYWKLGRVVPVPWVSHSLALWRALQEMQRVYKFDLIRFVDGYGEGFRYSLSPFAPFTIHLHGPISLLQRWNRRRVPKIRARAESFFERWPATRATFLSAGSRSFANLVADEWCLEPSRICIIRNPIDTDLFTPAPVDFPRRKPIVLFAGHVQWLKGVATLAQAVPQVVARHPRVEFRFIGSDTDSAPNGGSLRQFITAMLSRLGVMQHVMFIDPVPHHELVNYYRECAVFVLPSFREAYGNVVLEAMACGRPCVVTNTIGAAELIRHDDTGLLVRPDDPTALADALCDILAMPECARNEMGLRARQVVEQTCAIRVIAAQSIEAYHRFLPGTPMRDAPLVVGE